MNDAQVLEEITVVSVAMIRSNTTKGGWELLYKGLAGDLENAGIILPQNKTNPVKEFLKVKDEGIFKKIEEQRLIQEEKAVQRAVEIEKEKLYWEEDKITQAAESRWMKVILSELKVKEDRIKREDEARKQRLAQLFEISDSSDDEDALEQRKKRLLNNDKTASYNMDYYLNRVERHLQNEVTILHAWDQGIKDSEKVK